MPATCIPARTGSSAIPYGVNQLKAYPPLLMYPPLLCLGSLSIPLPPPFSARWWRRGSEGGGAAWVWAAGARVRPQGQQQARRSSNCSKVLGAWQNALFEGTWFVCGRSVQGTAKLCWKPAVYGMVYGRRKAGAGCCWAIPWNARIR